MRVTNNMMVSTLMYNLSKNLNRMNTDQKHLASGKRIHAASDDPVDASKVLKYYTDLSELNQYDVNVRDALNWLEVTESSIADSGATLQRLREIAVQAANGVLTTDDRSKLAAEVKNLKEHLIQNGNFAFAGRYVFSGYQTDRPLFNEDGSYNIDITYGDYVVPARNRVLIGTGETLQVTTNGIDVFGVADVPNAFITMYTNTAGDNLSNNKSAIKGAFSLVTDYSGDTLDVNLGGFNYVVNSTGLSGSESVPLSKSVVIDRYKQALVGGVGPAKLQDVADIYFDKHNNLVIESKLGGIVPITTAATNYKPASLYTGDVATKSVLSGTFALEGVNADYTGQNLDVVVGGTTYQVDETSLNGNNYVMTKQMVLTQLREALAGGVGPAKLSDVADVFFNEQNQLVIKEKAYGANVISMPGLPTPGFNPVLTLGQNTGEASLDFSNFTFDDAHIAANEVELKQTPMYITYNGERRAVKLNPSAVVTTVAQYSTQLQIAIDAKFGAGRVNVAVNGAAPNEYLSFNTVGTTPGKQPELRVEIIKSKSSSLMVDMDDFYTALTTGDDATIKSFIGKADTHLNRMLSVRAEIGAKVNRMELVKNRISSNIISFTTMLSETEDVDMAETIMLLKNAEAVYRASLSTGSRVIQPTLIDFLR